MKILAIKENFEKEKRDLEKNGDEVTWVEDLNKGKEMLKKNFDLVIIGAIFLNQKNEEKNGKHHGKRGGARFIQDHPELLKKYIDNKKIILYSWDKEWADEKKQAKDIAKEMNIPFWIKSPSRYYFLQKIKKLRRKK